MTIETKKNEQELVVEVAGRLDTTTASVLEAKINEQLGDIKSILIDLKGLEYISSAGLRVLLSTHKKMSGALTLINACESVMDVFEITGFVDILTIK